MNKLTELWIKVTKETEIEEYPEDVRELYEHTRQLQQKVNQLEEDYKNEVEENLKLSELWRKSQEKVNQLETNIATAIDYINKLEFEEYGVLYDNGTPIMEYEDNCKETLLEILRGDNYGKKI